MKQCKLMLISWSHIKQLLDEVFVISQKPNLTSVLLYFERKQEAISQKEMLFRFRKDIQSLRKAGVLISCA